MHKSAARFYALFRPKDAVGELQKILRIESRNFEALVKLARACVDIGDLITESGSDWKERKAKEYAIARGLRARRAVKVNPHSTWGYFWIAASLGNIAMIWPISRQVELAGEIRDEVEKALELDPKNGLAYHGVWHRKVAEIGAASRVLASVLYRRSLPHGTLEKSIEYLKKAVALNPRQLFHVWSWRAVMLPSRNGSRRERCSDRSRICQFNFPTTPKTSKKLNSYWKKSRIVDGATARAVFF